MSETAALQWFREMLWTAVLTAGPVVLAVIAVGLLVAIVQAATQVNDQAVAFGPKAVAVMGVLATGAAWMLGNLARFAQAALEAMARLGPGA